MEFTHTLIECFPDEILEVRGNADALAVTLKEGTDISSFVSKLRSRFHHLEEPQKLFIKCEGDAKVEPLVLE